MVTNLSKLSARGTTSTFRQFIGQASCFLFRVKFQEAFPGHAGLSSLAPRGADQAGERRIAGWICARISIVENNAYRSQLAREATR